MLYTVDKQLKTGANDGIRTRDLLITNQLLYQLSYIGVFSVEMWIFLKSLLALYLIFCTGRIKMRSNGQKINMRANGDQNLIRHASTGESMHGRGLLAN